jgi:phosphatidylglycerol lysyltransferase
MPHSDPYAAALDDAEARVEEHSAERRRVLAILKRHGWNSTSFQVLEPGLSYWFGGDDVCVAYMDTGRAWVVAGAPIASEENLAAASATFCRLAREKGRRVAFFAAERRLLSAFPGGAISIGEQPIYDPAEWGATVAGTRSLREQLNRARSKGVSVQRVAPAELSARSSPLRLEIEALIARWVGQRPMPPMGFLVRVHPFSFVEERRSFVARKDGAVIGFAGVIPIYARNGCFIEDLIRAPHAPNGTVELLVDAAMRDAAASGKTYVTLGLAPLAGAVEFWLSTARKYGSALYDFAGLAAFKAKFRPKEWATLYLAYPPRASSYLAVYDSLAAFARGRLLRYGLEAFLRGPDIVVRLLAALLVPWTVLLALLDGPRWFGAAWVQWFWVVFDVALCATLLALSTQKRRRLANIVLGLVIFDALASLVQALVIAVPRIRTGAEAVIVVAGVLAPTLACIVLTNFRRRVQRNRA